jgi:predicted HicB family RNase H-like nuclease
MTFRLPEEERKALAKAAEAQDKSQAKYVQRAVERALREDGFLPLKRVAKG